VVAKAVPRELGDRSVVLMFVVTVVGEDHVGSHGRLQSLEEVLDVGTDVREVALAKVLDADVGGGGIA
jgi:hypothetical protein